MRHLKWLLPAAAVVLLVLVYQQLPARLERGMNTVTGQDHGPVSDAALSLHNSLVIGDLHTDTTLWRRDMRLRSDYGHVDLPRLREGNVALQMFTSVIKSPRGQNYSSNSADAQDTITLLAVAQGWPPRTWSDLTERALYQAERLRNTAQRAPDELQLVIDARGLQRLLRRREAGESVVGGLLGIEGAHALEGKLERIAVLRDAGFRMIGLHHFFDNRLGGSLHGTSEAGLTEFGRQVVRGLQDAGIMVDLAHSSEQSVSDALTESRAPMIVSHTGFQGHCATDRNISDASMQRIAAGGGLIGVGYWDAAVCDATPKGIVGAIRYGIDLLGLEHIALGSDFDGAINAPFDTSQLALLTQAMLDADFSEHEIRAVMGGNLVRFLGENLP